MPTTPPPNQRVAQALELVRKGLETFIRDLLQRTYRDRWVEEARKCQPDRQNSFFPDVPALVNILQDRRTQTLAGTIPPKYRSHLFELQATYRKHTNHDPFDDREADRALETTELLLRAIRSPEALAATELRRQPPATPASLELLVTPAAPVSLKPDSVGIERGVRLFRYLADKANRGNAVGIGYAAFLAFLHNKATFQELAGRNYLPSDSGIATNAAFDITEANGGRIEVVRNARSIQTGMDSYIWNSASPYSRPANSWKHPRHTLPYTSAEWSAVFPDNTRRLVKERELAALA